MPERKPNNLPWIVLGGLCGVAILGLFAFGVYSGATSFGSEVTLEFDDSLKPEITDTKIVRVTGDGVYFIDDVNSGDLSGLKHYLDADLSPTNSTQIWVMIDNDTKQSDIDPLTAMISDMGYYFPGIISRSE